MTTNRLYSGLLTIGCIVMLGAFGNSVYASTSWSQLSSKQQELLAPLKKDWDTMTNAQQERWLQVGRKYENEPSERQDIMRERVGGWSELSPKEKAAARENYKALKENRQGERNSSWNSYKSLDQKKRDEFKSKDAKQTLN